MSDTEKYRLWLVDTHAESLALIERTLKGCDFVSIRHVTAAEVMIAELGRNIGSPDELPHVVLLDFFMETMTAPEILPEIQQQFLANDECKPYIVAFSTMDKANDAMLGMGADHKIEQKRDADTSADLAAMFASRDALKAQLAQRGAGEAEAIALPADPF